MLEEVWKDIPGFVGYQISNLGRVRSCRINKGTGKGSGSQGKSTTTYGLGLEWKEVDVHRRMAIKNHWRPIIVIRKFGERKTYTFQVGRLMWEIFKGSIPDGMILDHIDGNPFNNSWNNLRICTQKQNLQNRRKRIKRTSQYKGVYLHKRSNKWIASIAVNKTKLILGVFDNEIDAAKAYNEAALVHYKEFASVNIIDQEIQ